MKKLLQIVLIVSLALILVLSVTACGKKDEVLTAGDVAGSNTEAKNDAKDTSKSKTYKLFSQLSEDYVLSLEGEEDLGDGEETIVMTVAVKGKNICMDLLASESGQHYTVIYKDNKTYTILHEDKMYLVDDGKDEESFEDMQLFSAEDLDEIKDEEYTTGKEKIDGKEYYYEEYKDEDGNPQRFYFSGDDLKYIKTVDDTEETLIKVNKISSKVDDSLFDIPADYELFDFDI